jgi:hypothetical protein
MNNTDRLLDQNYFTDRDLFFVLILAFLPLV